ncbi:1,4-alpha-glucan branching protein GlgB [Deinococcus yavapaiensis]|uniref:1,4-alpha-glucan branching enzyme GlgB n=1 Tax=Deinococcus yavapaiensis KR-236 TaxID=694435 RepID=A0A318SF78_9DEIO|nr:1,4-alpha-glucan branching protein GlgB [Deinococcus yavapaiensis]PYE56447.1 1,4-alpha-glucan branching enzyme [Deinococcus yavapaiensis KR-236]
MSIPAVPSYLDFWSLASGENVRPDLILGAHVTTEDGVSGVRFACWAPNARTVAVVGDFNGWNPFVHPMQRHDLGFWHVFVPNAEHGQLYKFAVTDQAGRTVHKSDPYGRFMELRPNTASVVWSPEPFEWTDNHWMATRTHAYDAPMSIYEVHLASWSKREDGWYLDYREIGHRLTAYAAELGFTHVELMGVLEHPFDGSWGYQVTGYYAPTSRHGTPEDFRWMVNHLHENGIGVILDWVPGHFPTDESGLAHWDGTSLFEYADPRKGYHPDWNTYVFDYGRNEVVSFLMGSALIWLEDYHVDGLRVDAVASMIYLDFSRNEWIPNVYGGRENLEAISFMKRLNDTVHGRNPGAMMIAEESTAFPGVTWPTPAGLGFDYKWAMGWMNDTLAYFEKDPIYRQFEHHKVTFFNVYRQSEHFILAISHDEVVHLKKSMVGKMPGNWYEQRAGLRAFLALQWATPGKKLLFMGQEFAQGPEWNFAEGLPWYVLDHAEHAGVQRLVRDLNHLYRDLPALHKGDHEQTGQRWLGSDDASNSVYSFLRCDPTSGAYVVVVASLTPLYREQYKIGVPEAGRYKVVLSTDAREYGGYSTYEGDLTAVEGAWHGQPNHLRLNLAPNSVLYLVKE